MSEAVKSPSAGVGEPASARREAIFVQAFLLPVCLTLVVFVRQGWAAVGVTNAPLLHVSLPAMTYAPQVYRVLYPVLFAGAVHLFPRIGALTLLSGFDLVFSYLALSLLYRVALTNLRLANCQPIARPVAVVVFLACVPFPICWIVPFQRSETTPSALCLAGMLFCLTYGGTRKLGWTALALLALMQSLLRSDVALVFGLSLMLLGAAGALPQLGGRMHTTSRGAVVLAIAAATQAYLQFVLFPHARYAPGSKPIQLSENLHPHNLGILLVAVLPIALLGLLLAHLRLRLTSLERLILVSSAIFAAVWLTFGAAAEVRIFVPYMLALCVVAARAGSAYLLRPVP